MSPTHIENQIRWRIGVAFGLSLGCISVPQLNSVLVLGNRKDEKWLTSGRHFDYDRIRHFNTQSAQWISWLSHPFATWYMYATAIWRLCGFKSRLTLIQHDSIRWKKKSAQERRVLTEIVIFLFRFEISISLAVFAAAVECFGIVDGRKTNAWENQ